MKPGSASEAMENARDPRTFAILGAAMEAHTFLGSGYLEAVYHDALEHELRLRSIPYEREAPLPVFYKGVQLGAPYRADFLCFGSVILELKAKRDLGESDRNQVVHYLKTSGLSTGLLLNFGEDRLDYQRFAFNHGSRPEEASAVI